MALSFANRRRAAQTTSKSWALQKQSSISVPSSTGSRQHLALRKQYSFIETPTGSQKYTTAQRSYLTRGLSVERSIESIRQKLYATGTEQTKLVKAGASGSGARLSRQSSVDAKKSSTTTTTTTLTSISSSSSPTVPAGVVCASGKHITVKQLSSRNASLSSALSAKHKSNRNLAAWSSTSSLMNSYDKEDAEANDKSAMSGAVTDCSIRSKRDNSEVTAKTDSNRINLNIVLSQTIRATTEQEIIHSDIESSTTDYCVDTANKSASSSGTVGATERRAQFQHSRNNTINTSTTNNITSSSAVLVTPTPTITGILINSNSNSNGNSTQLSISPALTVQRRPPLVRAMSAPVRSLDENSKSVIAANKQRQQKLRRRKILTRNPSCDKSGSPNSDNNNDNIINADGAGNKKVLARSRTVVAPDVITLVSLLSSDGSDSEKEENSSTTSNSNGHSERSPTRRAPFLRKTGKSVSFQDNFPPTFQLASKEYSHMLRRGSIAPLAARIRSNRPPTAPPVSIFLSDPHKNQKSTTGGELNKSNSSSMSDGAAVATPSSSDKSDSASASPLSEKENNAANCNVTVQEAPEYNYPDYVRSIKERECWKLFQKMSAKGVNVTYDTILRGMLTPTEFRQLQKQRELEEAKAQEAAEAAAEIMEKPKPPPTAVERLSESLLNNKK